MIKRRYNEDTDFDAVNSIGDMHDYEIKKAAKTLVAPKNHERVKAHRRSANRHLMQSRKELEYDIHGLPKSSSVKAQKVHQDLHKIHTHLANYYDKLGTKHAPDKIRHMSSESLRRTEKVLGKDIEEEQEIKHPVQHQIAESISRIGRNIE